MAEGTLARPKQGVAKMPEVSGNTGQVGGTSQELSGGVYRHPATGEEIIALTDPITGDAQARGYVRAGFEWVRDVKEGDVKEVGLDLPSVDHAKQPERGLEAKDDELKGLRARINALEAAADKDKARVEPATEDSQEHAKETAKQKVDERGTDNSGDLEVASGVNTTAEPTKDSKDATSNKKESEK